MAATDRAMAQDEPYIEDVCEQLFLLEVLVDKIDIKTEGLLGSIEKKEEVVVEEEEEEEEDEDDDDDEAAWRRREEKRRKKRKKKTTRPIKVKVKFFDFPTIEIEEWDFTEAKEERAMQMDALKEDADMDSEEEELRADEEDLTVEEYRERRARRRMELAEELAESMPPGDKFCSGKSCLFPMIPLDLVKAIKKSPLNVQVHRAGDAEQGPRLIGRTSIDLGENFIEAIILASSPSVLPVSAFIDGPYPLKNVFGETTATVYLYLRISCFGNSIFTQFKLKEGEKDYLFKMTGRKMDAAERTTERLKCGKKSEDYLPKLSPIFTKLEDFTVGAKAPVFHSVEPKLKVPISWHKSGTKTPTIKICAPEKMYKKPPTRTKYRKTFTIEQQILQRVIPGFGRQAGDPDFIKNNPTLPRYCEMKKKEADIGDGSTILTSEIQEDSEKTEESSYKTPGAKFPCQYGTSWKPVAFPLPREELYPKMKSLLQTEPTPLQSPTEEEAMLQDSIYSVQNREQRMAVNDGKTEVYLKCTCMKISRSLNQSHVGCECANTIKSKYLEPPKQVVSDYDVPNVRLEEYKPVEDVDSITDCLEKKFPIPPEDSDKMIFMLKVDDNHFEETEKPKRKRKQKLYKVTIKGDCFGECFGDCFDKNWTNLTLCKQIQKIAQKTLDKLKPDDEKVDLKEIKEKKIHEKTGCTNVDCKCSCKTGRTKFKQSSRNKGKEGAGKAGSSDEERGKRGEAKEEKSRVKTERVERKPKANEKLITKRTAQERPAAEGKPAQESIKSKGVAGKPGKDSKSNIGQMPADASLTQSSRGKKEKKAKEKSADKEKSATLEDFRDLLSARGKLLDITSDSKQPNLKENGKKGIKYIHTSGKYPGIQVGHQTCIPTVQIATGGIQERCKGLYHEIEEGAKKETDTRKKNNHLKEVKKEKPRKKTQVKNESDELEKMSKNYIKLASNEAQVTPTLHIHKTKGKYSIVMLPTDPLREGINKDERVMFTVDTKHPDGYRSSEEEFSTADTSTVSDDSMLIEYTSPLGIHRLNGPRIQHSLSTQTDTKKKLRKLDSSDHLVSLEASTSLQSEEDNGESSAEEQPFDRSRTDLASGPKELQLQPSSTISPQSYDALMAGNIQAAKQKASATPVPSSPIASAAATLSKKFSPADKKHILIMEPKLEDEAIKFHPPPMTAQPQAAILKLSKFHRYGYTSFEEE